MKNIEREGLYINIKLMKSRVKKNFKLRDKNQHNCFLELFMSELLSIKLVSLAF